MSVIYNGKEIEFPIALLVDETNDKYSFVIALDGEVRTEIQEDGKECEVLEYKNTYYFSEKKEYINKEEVFANPISYVNYNPINEMEIIKKQQEYIDMLKNCILELSEEVYK